MSMSGSTPNVAHLDLSESDTDDLFASPSRPDSKHTDPTADLKAALAGTSEVVQTARNNAETVYDIEEAREDALHRELDGIKGINEVIEGVVESLEKAKGNMETVSRTVNSASTLLNTWIRILSQTEHNQRLILNPNWHGASQDALDIENESVLRQQAIERREYEEQQRKEAAARKLQEEDQRRADGVTGKGARGRGRGRASTRGSSLSSSGYGSTTTQSRGASRGGSTPGIASSGLGRGVSGSTRSRGRGLR